MKILILNLPGPVFKAGTRWPSKISYRKDQIRYYPYPWFMGYATSLLKKNGLDVIFKDAIAMEWGNQETFSYIKKLSPRYLVCETTAISLDQDISFLNKLDKRIIKINVGQFATANSWECIKAGFDYSVVGEYEFSLLGFFKSQGEMLPVNFVSKNKKKWHYYPLIENLDSLPYPERDDTPVEYFNEPSCYGRNIVMVSSRGCRFNCSYCTVNSFYGKRGIRTRSAENVVDEMEYLKNKYAFDEIYFDDDNITAKLGHLESICKEIIKRKLKISWVCMGDALIPLETVDSLAKASCSMYKFGVEHFDEEVLKAIPKPLSFEKVSELVKRCKKNGMRTHLAFMVGLPKSSYKKDLEMVKKVISINPTAVQFAIAMPYPGTRFYQESKKNKWLIKDGVDVYASGKSVVSYPNYSSKKITEMFRLAWKLWRRHIIFSQPKSSWFYFSGNIKREGLIKTLQRSLAYCLNIVKRS